MEEIRLQKYLADSGVASRRKCEEYILAGRVKVNGEIITELGTKINPDKVQVEFDNKIIKNEEQKVYILLNKPIGYVTTADDQFRKRNSFRFSKNKRKNSSSRKTRYVYFRSFNFN